MFTGTGAISTLIEFKIITLPEVTDKDVENIKKAIASDTMGQSLENVERSIRSGETLLWRWSSPEGDGVLMTQEYAGTKEMEMFIWYLGGAGLKNHGVYITNVLEEFCRLRGLCRITAIVKPGIHRFLQRFGYGIDRYLISKEVPNGRGLTEHNENDPGHPV